VVAQVGDADPVQRVALVLSLPERMQPAGLRGILELRLGRVRMRSTVQPSNARPVASSQACTGPPTGEVASARIASVAAAAAAPRGERRAAIAAASATRPLTRPRPALNERAEARGGEEEHGGGGSAAANARAGTSAGLRHDERGARERERRRSKPMR
jgi:hypothetical protein